MSFLTRAIPSRAFAATASASRFATARTSRTFTTSSPVFKTPTESVKDGLKTVDRAVSDKLVDGINLATAAKAKVKQTADQVSKSDAAAKAEELKDSATGKAQELRNSAAGKAEELKGSAAGKTEELKGRAKGTAEEAKGKAKGTTEEVKSNL